MVVKTYRGMLAHAGFDRIRLQTIKGKQGYRIEELRVISYDPTETDTESVIQIYNKVQSASTQYIDFTNSQLLAVGLWTSSAQGASNPEDMTIIADKEIFNQDIFIYHHNRDGTSPCNYYLELEVIPLDDAGAEYTTLKDIRQT